MKKFLSLLLALVMLSSLAVTASADSVYSLSDLLDFYKDYLHHDEPDYDDLVDYLSGNTADWWYENCPKCNGLAFFRISGGSVKYACLKKDCRAEGSIVVIPDNKEEVDKVPETDLALATECASCYRTAFFDDMVEKDGKLYYRYICAAKHETMSKVLDYSDKDTTIKPDLSPIKCERCDRIAEFEYLTVNDGDVYAVFVCSKDHKNHRLIREDIEDDDDKIYRVKVILTGEGTYQIADSHYGAANEYKYIRFTPAPGYELTKVLVNGRNVNFTKDEVAFRLTDNTTVRATFSPILKNHKVTADVTGSGEIKATVNGKTVDASSFTVRTGDKVTFKFVPASDNYYVSAIKVNGKTLTPSTSYTISKVSADTSIKVKFAWKNPFTDVSAKYTAAVEYVTEAGVMTAAASDGKNLLFKGTAAVTEQAFAAALAELADTADKLDTAAQRIVWAETYGLVEKDADLSGICDVQTAVKMINQYLLVLEAINDVEFDSYDADISALENAINLGLVSGTTYEKNRNMTRYDLAAVCRKIATLKYTD